MDDPDSTTERDARELTDGIEVQALGALRRVLATRLASENTDDKTIAGMSREYRAVLTELRRLGAGRKESRLDDLAARRAKRRGAARPADAANPQPPAVDGHVRP